MTPLADQGVFPGLIKVARVAMLAARIDTTASMPLLPRWQYMTDQSKALVTKTTIGLGVVLVAALLLRSLFPWVVLVLICWLVWQVMARR